MVYTPGFPCYTDDIGGVSMNELIQLFTVFARIGAVTFGGDYAMLPILQAEVVEKYHWASEEELADYYFVFFPLSVFFFWFTLPDSHVTLMTSEVFP